MIQSIPNIRSIPAVLNTIGVTLNSTPLKIRLVGRQQYEASIIPPGELIIIGFFMAHKGMLCVLKKV
jgi:hypothetical protein